MENQAHTEMLIEEGEIQQRDVFAELGELELTMVGGGIGDVQI